MTVPEFLEQLRGVMQLVRVRLASRKARVPGDESIEDLEQVLKMLAQLESQLSSGNLPPKNWRSRLLVEDYALDSWGYRSELAQHISNLSARYQILE